MKKICLILTLLSSTTLAISQTLYVPNFTSGGIVDSPNGNVGIGTATPDMKLSILSKDRYISRFSYDGSESISGIRTGRSSSYGDLVNLSSGFGIGAGTYSGNLPLYTQNTDHIDFFISNSNGNVGIGTTTPDMKLSILSKDRYISRFSYDGSESISGIRTGRSSSYGDLVNFSSGFGIGAGTYSGNLPLYTQNTDHIDFFISNSNGNVGIGTTTPDMKLSILSKDRYISRFSYDGSESISGIRTGRSSSYGDLVNFSSGFGIGAGTYSGNLPLYTQNTDHIDFFISNSNGNVGIGTTIPDSKLTVAGKIHSQEVKVTVGAGADFVFEGSYKLRTLEETETFIKQNNHLPEIASANEMIKEGIELGEMNIKLLQKIEELTLYLIEQNKEIQELKKEVSTFKNE